MVSTLEPYNIVLLDLQSNLTVILRDIFLQKSKIIVKLIQEEQLSEGYDGDNKEIGRYTLYTELISRYESPKPIRFKKEGELFNMEWTGRWFKGMRAELQNEERFSIFSIDGKHKELVEKYGENIMKLNPELNKFVNEKILKPALYQYFVDKLSFAA